MERIFPMDGKFFTFITKLSDLLLLNVLFIITCLPILTIGVSLTALYQTTLQLADNTDSYILRNFFSNWKQNLKQGILIWIPSFIMLILCIFNLSVLPHMPQNLYRTTCLCLQFVLLFFLYGIFLYAFSLPKVYRSSCLNTLRNALFMTFKHLPVTCLCLCISVIPYALIILLPKITGWILSFFIVIGSSGTAYIHSYILQKVFKKYIL